MLNIFKAILLLAVFSVSTLVSAETMLEIKQAAEQGNALAQAKFGSLFILGRKGAERDPKRAAQWMSKAAKQGLVEAQVVMAAMYDMGYGVSGDKKTANQWYEKAAKQGHGTAMAILGKNPTAKGSVKFDYKNMRYSAGRQIPRKYALNFLMKK